MKFLCYIERINRINYLLHHRATGTPGEFACKIGVSRTRLYEMLDELRSYGAPISYNRTVRTFYYHEPFDIQVALSIKPLSTVERKTHLGGAKQVPSYFFSGRCVRIFTERNVTAC